MGPVKFVSLGVLAIVLTLSSPNVYAARESVQVTKLANPVTIDGRWTNPDEWSDTNRVSMYLLQGPQSTGYIRLKHDPDFLYLLVDFVSDTTKANDQTLGTGDTFDGLNVGIDYVNLLKTNCCDVYVQLKWSNGMSVPAQTTPSWVESAISYDATNDPDSATAHAIYEVAFPKESIAPSNVAIAARISVWDWSRGVNMHWPQWQGPTGVSGWDTKYFGELTFSEVTVPELPLPALVLVLSLAVTYAVVTRRAYAAKRSK
jgi:hypothetical protein